MVNADKVRRKLPSLLCDESTTDKRQWAKRHRMANGLKRLRKQNNEKHVYLCLRLILDLEDIDEAIIE